MKRRSPASSGTCLSAPAAGRRVPGSGDHPGRGGPPSNRRVSDRLAPEGRAEERFTIVWAGGLEYGDQVTPCVLLNVSEGGAMIRTAMPLDLGSSVSLWSHKLGRQGCRVAWQDGSVAGLQFHERPGEIAKIVEAAAPAAA